MLSRCGILLLTALACLWPVRSLAAGVFWSAARLDRLRADATNTASPFADALQQLRADAAKAARSPVFSVTRKQKPAPSGDLHDYTSFGPYWWPDPARPNGLPYIRRDGVVNPEGRGPDSDVAQLRGLSEHVPALALSWTLFRNESHARHAGRLLRGWFLDPATRMNPRLTHAQAVPGHNEGRGLGIIDGVRFLPLPDAVLQLRGAPGWSAADEQGVRRWFAQYLDWLRDSAHGAEARRAANNHGTWYDVQCAAYARFLGRDALAVEILRAAPARRIDPQIGPDGRQPHELERTHAWGYSLMNLDAFLRLAALAPPDGPDLWRHRGPDGQGLPAAVRYLARFADPSVPWPHRELDSITRADIVPLLWQAAALPGASDLPAAPPPAAEQLRLRAWLQYGPLPGAPRR